MSAAAPTTTPQSIPAADGQYVETVIRPQRGWIGIDWRELLNHRELLYFLTWRDVKVKYKQAVFGPAWAIVVPLVSALIYYAVGMFAGFARQTHGDHTPYIVWVYAGLLPWLFIQTAINGGGQALVNNQTLLSKIYMPRLFIPTSMIGSAIVDMTLSGIIFVGMVLFFVIKTGGAFMVSWQIVFLPFLLILLLVGSLGAAYLLSALTVMFRDLRFIIPFIVQLGIWLTAVVYPQTIFIKYARDAAGNILKNADGTQVVLADYRNWLALNPFAGIVQGFRSAILGEPWQWVQLISSIVLCSFLFVFGLAYFKRVERRFADIA